MVEPPITKSEGFPYRLLTRLSPPPERRYWAVCFTSTDVPTAEGFKYLIDCLAVLNAKPNSQSRHHYNF